MRGFRARELRKKALGLVTRMKDKHRGLAWKVLGKKNRRVNGILTMLETGCLMYMPGTFRRIYRDLKKGYVNG